MNKTLSKEIKKRSRLGNKFLNTRSDLDRKAYNKQRNSVVSLLRKERGREGYLSRSSNSKNIQQMFRKYSN